MEEGSDHDSPLQLPLAKSASNVNYSSRGTRGDTNHHCHLGAAKIGNQSDDSHLTRWIQTGKPSSSYVEFLAESLSSLPKAPSEHMLESILADSFPPADGVPKFQGELPYKDQGTAGILKPAVYATSVEERMRDASWMKEPTEGGYAASQPNLNLTASTSGVQSRPSDNVSRQRAKITDRNRRLRINERLNALQELLPHPTKGSQASGLDDVIDHIKYLQLQIKDLSESRLGGEAISEPFIFREGYGHYLIDQQMLNEPLEEMMGKLLEVNPLAAAQLLEGKGLFLTPMDFVEGYAKNMDAWQMQQ